ncbi:MAG: ExbD/TolR family protein [Pseudoxanthomonas sp.]
MAAGIFHRKRRKLKSEINVVPYIDVMLVLLVIFMVTAPLLTLSVDVKLPSSTAKAVDSKAEPVIVVAYPDGRLGLQLPGDNSPREVDAAGLEAMLAPVKAQQGNDLRVLLAGDKDAPYQRVIDATEALRKAKVTNVVLWTKQ